MRAFALGTLAVLVARAAQASDPAAAREQLKIGYALKKAGRCSDAIPHFLESQRLSPTPKALLNLADCEELVGDLVSAQRHSVEARDRARQDADPLLTIAIQRVATLEGRLPRLTISLAPDAPPETTVSRDGNVLGAVSLNSALPANPGRHVVIASASGHADKSFEVVLTEGTRQNVEVAPGEALAVPSPPAAVPATVPAAARERAPWWTPRKTVAVSLVVAGAGGVTAGSIFGLVAIDKNKQSNADDHCDATGCDTRGRQLRMTAANDALVSTVAFSAGLAAAAVGVVVWATAPAARATRSSLDVAPSVGPHHGGISASVAW